MRRLLSEPRHYLTKLVHAVREGWDAFFFTPADPTALALIRVATGLLAMWSLLVFGLDLHDYLRFRRVGGAVGDPDGAARGGLVVLVPGPRRRPSGWSGSGV